MCKWMLLGLVCGPVVQTGMLSWLVEIVEILRGSRLVTGLSSFIWRWYDCADIEKKIITAVYLLGG